ncbi:Carbamoyl-phosphate synthase [Phytophthora megakarya]|uniref:Carbamoyl-phosphate synthase n=1 Tax=Phytophthora megakarya TaxID=4795 RepID=A0A225V540_9STRA|nr:Carbamoyl-phosphate synthase [Phytophthora megakarya]
MEQRGVTGKSTFGNGSGKSDTPVNQEARSLESGGSHPTNERLFYIVSVQDVGYTIDRVHELTKIDK